jgi:hypothetical protein
MQGVFKGDEAQACSLMSAMYPLGLVLIQFAPETNGQPLPE